LKKLTLGPAGPGNPFSSLIPDNPGWPGNPAWPGYPLGPGSPGSPFN